MQMYELENVYLNNCIIASFGFVLFVHAQKLVIFLCPTYDSSITLGCLNQMLWNLYILLITTKHRSSMNFGGVSFTVLELYPFTKFKIAEFFVSFLKLKFVWTKCYEMYVYNAFYNKTKF